MFVKNADRFASAAGDDALSTCRFSVLNALLKWGPLPKHNVLSTAIPPLLAQFFPLPQPETLTAQSVKVNTAHKFIQCLYQQCLVFWKMRKEWNGIGYMGTYEHTVLNIQVQTPNKQ